MRTCAAIASSSKSLGATSISQDFLYSGAVNEGICALTSSSESYSRPSTVKLTQKLSVPVPLVVVSGLPRFDTSPTNATIVEKP